MGTSKGSGPAALGRTTGTPRREDEEASLPRAESVPLPDLQGEGHDPAIPRHVAVIMDGNGRWARRRHLPRIAGHKSGVDTVKGIVRACAEKRIRALTLFAFSSENWRRPKEEVGMLMGLFMTALDQQVRKLHQNDIRLRVIGDRTPLPEALRNRIRDAERLTGANTGLQLVIAANYGGRWDIAQAARRVARAVAAGEIGPEEVTTELLGSYLCLSDLPEPDLFIRTGGEQRISNFLLWQLAYTEFYFTDTLWPDFDRDEFEAAVLSYQKRQRRFGRTSEQLSQARGR